MIELPLVFLGGLLGSAHCVGMCGGFAVSIGLGSRGFAANLRRQVIYTAGPNLHLLVLRSRRRVHGASGSPVEPACGSTPRRLSRWSRACCWPVKGCWLWESCRAGSGRGLSGGGAAVPGRNVRRAVPHLTAAVERSARRRADRLSSVRPGLRLSGTGEQLGEHPRRVAHDVPLRRGDRAAHDPRRYRRLAAVARGATEPLANLGRVCCSDGVDLDRPRDPVHPAHARTRSRSLPVLRSVELRPSPVAATLERRRVSFRQQRILLPLALEGVDHDGIWNAINRVR